MIVPRDIEERRYGPVMTSRNARQETGPSLPPLMRVEAISGHVSATQEAPLSLIAIVTVLLTVFPPIRTVTGTQHPVGAASGTRKTI